MPDPPTEIPQSSPSPFDPPERPTLATDRSSRPPGTGVGKPLLVGCGCLLLIAVAGLVALVVFQNSLLGWVLGTLEGQILPLVSDEVPPAERERLERAFAGARTAVEEGDFDPFALRTAVQEIQAIQPAPGRELSEDEVASLAEALEAVANPPPAQE